jgi:hypothetical protein
MTPTPNAEEMSNRSAATGQTTFGLPRSPTFTDSGPSFEDNEVVSSTIAMGI